MFWGMSPTKAAEGNHSRSGKERLRLRKNMLKGQISYVDVLGTRVFDFRDRVRSRVPQVSNLPLWGLDNPPPAHPDTRRETDTRVPKANQNNILLTDSFLVRTYAAFVLK